MFASTVAAEGGWKGGGGHVGDAGNRRPLVFLVVMGNRQPGDMESGSIG